MTERIIDLAGVATVKSVKELTGSDALAYLWGLPVREEIVRCKDCKRQWVFDLSGMYGTHEHDQMYCALVAGHSRLVKPDGFCAWGERRDA